MRFYEALSDEQKRQFNAMDGSAERTRSPGNMATFCSHQAGGFIDLPARRPEEGPEPPPGQQGPSRSQESDATGGSSVTIVLPDSSAAIASGSARYGRNTAESHGGFT